MLRRTPSLTIGWIEQPSSAFLRFLASSFRTLGKLRQTMRRIVITLAGLVCAAAAFAAPAAAYEVDPLTRQPIEYADQTYRPQATVIPREVVPSVSHPRLERARDDRLERARDDRAGRLVRLHSHDQRRRDRPLRPRARWNAGRRAALTSVAAPQTQRPTLRRPY